MGNGRSALSRARRWVVGGALLGWALVASAPASASVLTLEVTSPADAVGSCPHPTDCTLRAAILAANAATEASVTIRFAASAFPPDAPATISLAEPLPALTRDSVTIDASSAGVRIDGSALEGDETDGLVLEGAGAIVRGLQLEGFSGACLVLTGGGGLVGGDMPSHGNVVGACAVGIDVRGEGAILLGNAIGHSRVGAPLPVTTGIRVQAPRAIIGDTFPAGRANSIANADVGILLVEEGREAAIVGNRFGLGGEPSQPVATGVRIAPPVGRVSVTANRFEAVSANAIEVLSDEQAISRGNRFRQNTFADVAGLAIDLGGDSVQNPNDDGDADDGPNGLLNHPQIVRATQAAVEGIACPGCRVDLYLARHSPGEEDRPTAPLVGATAVANAEGRFVIPSPPVAAGQWVMAMATDMAGNSSEFGPSVLVGAGFAQCGPVLLRPGWNLAAYLGLPVSLGTTFPATAPPPGPVRAIHRLVDGSESFESWFAGGSGMNTLGALVAGEAYWFYATSPQLVSSGVTLASPLLVPLQRGWNAFVYIGADAHVVDALRSISGRYVSVYQWVNDGDGGRWVWYGGEDTPAWARAASVLRPCEAYYILTTDAVTLVPPQP